jgi:hypothetical protein
MDRAQVSGQKRWISFSTRPLTGRRQARMIALVKGYADRAASAVPCSTTDPTQPGSRGSALYRRRPPRLSLLQDRNSAADRPRHRAARARALPVAAAAAAVAMSAAAPDTARHVRRAVADGEHGDAAHGAAVGAGDWSCALGRAAGKKRWRRVSVPRLIELLVLACHRGRQDVDTSSPMR